MLKSLLDSACSINKAIKKIVLKYRFVFLFISVAVYFLLTVQPTHDVASGLIYFVGRFHPLLTHFPIALVILSLILELINQFQILKISPSILGFILGLGLIGSLVSICLGLMLFYTGEYSGDIINQHLLGGITFTSLLSLSIFLFLSYCASGSKKIYLGYVASLIVANIILAYTSHQGGSLTHGSEYLTEYIPSFSFGEETWEAKPIEEMVMFQDVIIPILERKCMSCHNDNKAKGNLNMTTYKQILIGGKSDLPALTPGLTHKSVIYRRVTISNNDDEVMPPEGKIPMTEHEILLLEWWINNGADSLLKVQKAALDEKIEPTLNQFIKELEISQRSKFLNLQSTDEIIQAVNKDNFVLEIDPYNEKGINLSMAFPSSNFGDNDLVYLEPIYSRVTKASFIGSQISDDGLYFINQMTSLEELYLQKTKVSGEGLVFLSNLKKLKLLDLSESEINNAQLLNIILIPSLKDLYLNKTQISKEIIEAINENLPNLNIHLERGMFF